MTGSGEAGSRRLSRLLAGLDALCALALGASIAYFADRTMVYDDSRLFRTPSGAYAAYATAAVAAILLLVAARSGRGRVRVAARFALVAAALVAGSAVLSRLRIHQFASTDDDRARFALRVAAHRISGGAGDDSAATIPREWPFPDDVELSVDRDSSGPTRLLARVRGGKKVCEMTFVLVPGREGQAPDQPLCRGLQAADSGRRFHTPRRVEWVAPRLPASASTGAWIQYRHDAERSGASEGGGPARIWRVVLPAGARATASAVGDVVLIGTHGAGTLDAVTLSTGARRWRVWVPSWIHQDAVSDGRTVVVGFGDNRGSIDGRAPGGVAAYDLASGRSLWTSFEHSSVMTSPVIVGDAIAYVTSAGVLRKRRLADGALLGTIRLPGGMPMAPPVLRHDTLVTSLDQDRVCATSFTTTRRIWCTQVPGMSYFGHSSASLIGDTVYVSGGVLPPVSKLGAAFHRVVLVSADDPIAQRVATIDLRTGDLLWRTGAFPFSRSSDGHISGTAAASERLVLISLPLANRVVAFDRGGSTERWSVGDGGTRGPVLVSGDRMYLVSHEGELRVHDLADGRLRCRIQLPRHYDRGGPALAGGALLLASLEGDLVALPKGLVDACDSTSVTAAFRD